MNADEAARLARAGAVDSVLIEFTDADLTEVPPDPAFTEQVLRRAPSWLREWAAARGYFPASPRDPVPLAECLLKQVRLLVEMGRLSEAVPKVEEVSQLYEQLGSIGKLADCFHVAADIHHGLGDAEKALEYLRREEEIRRRLAA